MTETTDWEGVVGSSEHRTTGKRAWCHDDKVWCYPGLFCPCCFHASPNWTFCPRCDGEGFVKASSVDQTSKPAPVRWASEK